MLEITAKMMHSLVQTREKTEAALMKTMCSGEALRLGDDENENTRQKPKIFILVDINTLE